MGIIDTVVKLKEDRDAFWEAFKVLGQRASKLRASEFYLEATLLATMALEELLRIDIDFFQKLFQTNAFNVRDKSLNVVLEVNFDALGLKQSSKLTLGELITRYQAFTGDNVLTGKLRSINSTRRVIVHSLMKNENRAYLSSEKHHELNNTEDEVISVTAEIYGKDQKIVDAFFQDLVRKTGTVDP